MTVKSGDMFDGPAGAEGGGERVDLHRVAGCLGFQGPGDAHCIGSPGPPCRFAIMRKSPDRGDRLACDPVCDHTPDRGRRDLVSVPAQDRRDLAATPGGTVLAPLCDPLPDRRAGWSLAAPVGPARQPRRGLFPAIQGGTGPMDRPGRVCRCQAITHGLTPAMDKILAHPDSGIAR